MAAAEVDFSSVSRGSVEWTNLVTLYLREHESRSRRPILGDRAAAEAVDRINCDFKRIHRTSLPASDQYLVELRAKRLDDGCADLGGARCAGRGPSNFRRSARMPTVRRLGRLIRAFAWFGAPRRHALPPRLRGVWFCSAAKRRAGRVPVRGWKPIGAGCRPQARRWRAGTRCPPTDGRSRVCLPPRPPCALGW